ncbi:hypothetical protein CPB84DRAFT_1797089 [Gymnopilus junonius]|uniref:MARVEL domain-containing protein n=1 Tax=Gymnopilus junonius TaxID=109634 RepID=A0A9P5NBK4_GYMJU|nr:hypothetical protein CPB84DRAFT_1797089 [Gymnopilus junonius]
MNYYYIYRNFVLGLCLLLTLPTLGLTAHWTQGTVGGTLSFEGMGIFVTCISLLVFPAMLLLSEFRKNAFFLYILSEIIVVLIMWILWMITMILVIEQRELEYPLNNCSVDLSNDQIHWCNELFAIQGLCIFIFVFLLKYLVFLTLFAFINHIRGIYIWKKSVKELQIRIPDIKLTHSSSDVDFEKKPATADASRFGAPSSYPPPQQAFPNPMQYTNSAAGMQAQLDQFASYSQRPPPLAAQTYTHSTSTMPAIPQV